MSVSPASGASLRPDEFTVEHFADYASRLVYDDGECHELEDWQRKIATDIFAGFTENWVITPEANSKSTFLAMICLYGAHFSDDPWIPVGAAAARQAKIIFTQAKGFVDRTPGLSERFKCLDGYKVIRPKGRSGIGIEIYAHDPNTGDGVIPWPFACLDELHRHPDLRLYSLWLGKLRKRGAQLLAASTAGEPNSPFENLRDQIRNRTTKRKRDGAYLRAEGGGLVLHEYMVQTDEECTDMEKVKEANPLSTVTVKVLQEQYDSPTRDDGDWKRLKCNRPARSAESAITDKEWDEAEVKPSEWDKAREIILGFDYAPKWDTTVWCPLWKGPDYRLVGPASIIVPPRNGDLVDLDEIKNALLDLTADRTVVAVAMDISRCTDLIPWLEDELGLEILEWGTSNKFAVEDFNSVTEGLRNGTLKHTGHPGLRMQVMNAIARRLPGGDYRFDRPTPSRGSVLNQDRRVIDALTAMGMAVSLSNRDTEPKKSVYEERFATA